MRKLLLIILIATFPFQALPQDDVRSRQAEKVGAVIQGFGQKATKITMLSRSLIGAKGKIIKTRKDSFDLKSRGRITTVPYAAVLELQGGGQSLSLVPERTTRNHGSWEDVGRIYPSTKIFIIFTDGNSVKGFSNSTSETRLVMFDEKGRERVELPRDQILAVYGLIGGYGGVKSGASKGAEGMATGSRETTLLGAVFAGIGALVGLAKS